MIKQRDLGAGLVVAIYMMCVGAPFAEAQNQPLGPDVIRCIGNAHAQMVGDFEVKGLALSDRGELAPITTAARVEAAGNNEIFFISDEKVFGRWWIDASNEYLFQTFDDDGSPLQRVSAEVQVCQENSSGELILERRWQRTDDGTTWEFNQTTRLSAQRISEITLVRNLAEIAPAIVVSDVNFSRTGN